MKPLVELNRRTAIPLLVLISELAGCGACFAGKVTPPSSARPWSPPQLEQYERDLARKSSQEKPGAIPIDPRKIYDLPELIDIAQRANPDTRVSWERARQAAAAVGLNQSAYYPYLIASAAAGFERTVIPVPSIDPVQHRLVGGSLVTDRVGCGSRGRCPRISPAAAGCRVRDPSGFAVRSEQRSAR